MGDKHRWWNSYLGWWTHYCKITLKHRSAVWVFVHIRCCNKRNQDIHHLSLLPAFLCTTLSWIHQRRVTMMPILNAESKDVICITDYPTCSADSVDASYTSRICLVHLAGHSFYTKCWCAGMGRWDSATSGVLAWQVCWMWSQSPCCIIPFNTASADGVLIKRTGSIFLFFKVWSL